MTKKKLDKYGNDDEQEAISDIHLFFPLADCLLKPLHKIGLTPNGVTLLSAVFTLAGVYYFYYNKMIYAYLFYLLGYLMDCIDGRMARKYNQGSILGMILDTVTDNVTNLPLIIIFITKTIKSYGTNNFSTRIILLFLIVVVTYVFSAVFGVNEAIQSYEKTKDDNFHNNKIKILKDTKYHNSFIGKLFLSVYDISYKSYRKLFPEKINKNNLQALKEHLLSLKEFGPGNYCLFLTFMMYMFSS